MQKVAVDDDVRRKLKVVARGTVLRREVVIG
jgi:hypothetical protein